MQTLVDGPCTTVLLPFAPPSVGLARRLLTRGLRKARVRASAVDDATLVLSELVANGLTHGRPDAHGNLEVCWCLHPHRLLLSVHDEGMTHDLRPLALDPASGNGRGLVIVDRISDDWRVESSSGTRVTAELAIARNL